MLGRNASGRLGALQAQRVFAGFAMRVAPAAAAGLIAAQHLGVGVGALLFFATLLAGAALEPQRHPMQLTPISAVALRALIPLAGATIVYLVALALDPIPAGEFVLPVAGAWIVTGLVAFIADRIAQGLEARIAVIGPGAIAVALARELDASRTRGYRVAGWVGDRPSAQDAGAPTAWEVRHLGTLDELGAVIRAGRIDLLVHADERPGVMEQIADHALGHEVRLIGANQLFEELFGHVPLATLNAAFFQYLMHPRFSAGSQILKRSVDLVFSVAAGVVLAPVVALAALAVKLGDGGPVFFRQVRVGQGGREFEIVKLRTMRRDAEAAGARWSAADDPRVTRVGRVLRRTHVDEFPQLWNTLRGEMTLVGPRPEVPAMVAELEHQIPFYDRRELVKPGITGWAQIRCGYAGSGAGTAWKLCHDLYYLKHRSLGLDLMIMLETVATAVHDVQFGVRSPDETFVLDAIRGVETDAVLGGSRASAHGS